MEEFDSPVSSFTTSDPDNPDDAVEYLEHLYAAIVNLDRDD